MVMPKLHDTKRDMVVAVAVAVGTRRGDPTAAINAAPTIALPGFLCLHETMHSS